MARRPSTFTQTDVTRALRAMAAAGIDVKRVEFDRDGKMIVVAGKPDNKDPEPGEIEL